MTTQTISNPPTSCIGDTTLTDHHICEQTQVFDYAELNNSIKETFTAINRFEWQAVDQILLMREQKIYQEGGYKSFEQYCQHELSAWGGYRRINQLLGAKKVIEAVGELNGHIKNERQARPLLRLVKEPEKLKQAVALALQENLSPSESDFAAAVKKVVPPSRRIKCSVQEPLVPKTTKVKISSQSHPRYGEEGVIETDPPNHWQQIVTLTDGEKLLVNNADLDAPSVPSPGERTYPTEYASAIASLKEQHKQELERLEQDLRIGLQAEATARAEQQIKEQLESLQKLFRQQKEQNLQLQQRLSEMEGLRQLEFENQQLRQRILELEHAVEQRPQEQWGDTFTKGATKAQKGHFKLALERTIDLRILAVESPKENAQECLRLMGMALKNLASAMNNTQALEAAAIILGSSPTLEAVTERIEQMQLVPVAVSQIKEVLAKPGCSWQDFWAVAQKYQSIELDYRAELTKEETELIALLHKVATQPPTIGVGSIVAHADPYCTLYLRTGEVVEDFGEEVLVAWEHWKDQSKKTDRYFKSELRLWQP